MCPFCVHLKRKKWEFNKDHAILVTVKNDAVQNQSSLTNDKSGIQNKQTIFNILIKSL